MKKRILSVMIAVLVIFLLTGCGESFPDESFTDDGAMETEAPVYDCDYIATMESGNGEAGDSVTVSVRLADGPELYSMGLKLSFDEDTLELVSESSGEAMSSFTYTKPSRLKSDANFIWYATDPFAVDGTVIDLVFKIKDTAEQGEYSIKMTCDPDNTFDANYNEVYIAVDDGIIIVG